MVIRFFGATGSQLGTNMPEPVRVGLGLEVLGLAVRATEARAV